MRPDSQGFFHPAGMDEVIALVQRARREGRQLRVAGSAHSVAGAIRTDVRAGQAGGLELRLDRLRDVRFDDASMRVTVGAGCNLGRDPRDGTGRSRADNSLCAQLDAHGWALPNLGGIAHQTVAGFLLTGSSGGSVIHNLSDSIVGLTLVDGTGTIHRLSRDEDAERVQAAAVSMGLLGIVVEVTFQCEPRYDVIGVEHTLPFDEVPFDLFGTGPGSLEAFLRDSEYSRIEWWPQAGVNRLVIWNARRMQAHDYTAETGPFGALKARTFETFDEIGSPAMTQAIGGAILAGISRWRPQLQGLFGAQRGRYASFLGQRFITGQVKRLLYEQFVPVQTDAPEFWDSWHEALPMDHTIDDRFMPVTFAELWLPLSETGRVMRRLERHFAEFGTRACGYMPFEIYAAGPSDLWLHPGHERPESLRLNFFWFNGTAGDPREFLQPFWDMVSDLGVRPHWGKLLPADPSWVQTHIKPNIPRWDDFVALRRQMDPDGLFLTAYWQSIFGDGASIADTPVAPSVTPASPLDLTFGERRRWPMLYTLAPSTLDDVDELPGQLYRDGHAEAQPEVLWPLIADFQRRGEWMRLLGHVELLTEDWAADDAAVVQTFAPLISVRARTIAREAPHLWAAAIDRASLPLVRRAAERFELTPDGRGGTHLRWTLAYELSDTALARRAPALLQRWFAASFEALLRLAAAHT
ncbi:MAG: FAD/FMN-containing dehydrogenase [Myxococcota bacterium]